jgi:serine/threonine protein kinase/formylglycine-generating enzyme required for sulfatase activity
VNTTEPSKEKSKTSAANFDAGQKIAGCYTLKRLQPASGPLTVWLVRDEELNKDLTLHFLPPSVVSDTRAMTELRQETKKNRQLIHPHILRVHDLIEEADCVAVSMDYVEGETLASLLGKRSPQAFSPAEIKGWVAQICQTLEDAHKVDLLHRDLGPENVIIKKSGDVVLANFGITRVILDSLERAGEKPQSEERLAYASPQLLDGERPTRSDDVYALGMLIYEMLTGKTPFGPGQLIPQIRKTVPQAISERRRELKIEGESVPKNWDREIAACLDKHTPARPKTAMEVASKLGLDRYAGPLTTPQSVGGAVAGSAEQSPKPAASPAAGEPERPASTTAEPAPIPPVATGTAESKPEATPKEKPAPKDQPAAPKTSEKAPEKPAPSKSTEKPAITPAKSPFAAKSSRPPVAEAEIISKTVVPPPGEEGGGKTPPKDSKGREFPHSAFVSLEEERAARKKQGNSYAILGIAAAVVIFGMIAYVLSRPNTAEKTGMEVQPSLRSESGELTTTKGNVGSESPSAANQIAAAKPAASPAAGGHSPGAATPTPPSTPPAGQTGTPAPGQPQSESERIEQARQLAVEKAREAEGLKQALAAAEKAQKERLSAQQAADAAAQEVQKQVDEKTAAAAAAQKAAEAALAAQKQREDIRKAAEAAAEEAQKMAAERTRAAAEARKAVDENIKQLNEQQTAQQKAEAELQDLQRVAAERRKVAQEAAKAAAEAEAARQQQAQAVARAEAESTQARTNIERVRMAEEARAAAAQAEAVRLERAKERERLMAQAAAAQKAAEEAARLVQAAQKAEEEAERLRAERDAAQKKAEAAAQAVSAMAPGAVPPASTPIPTPEPVKPGPKSPGPKAALETTLQNSLGMKFAPVGDVLFSVWLTRISDFEAFAKATNFKSNAWRQPGFKQGPDHPVVNVSWNDAIAFCKWLTEKEQKDGILSPNQSYRLPTDLEWSKAVGLPDEPGRTPEARDMDVPDVYPWGNEWPPPAGAGNYTGEETGSDVAIKGFDDGFAWTSPVGSFKASKYGLYDMGGNVWQWCMDWLNAEQKAKVLRGGSWYNGALKLSLLSSCRYHAAPDSSTDNFGFRIVATGGAKK